MKDPSMILRARLREALDAKIASEPGLTRTTICRRADVAESGLRQFLTGKSRSLNSRTAARLAHVLGVPSSYFTDPTKMRPWTSVLTDYPRLMP